MFVPGDRQCVVGAKVTSVLAHFLDFRFLSFGDHDLSSTRTWGWVVMDSFFTPCENTVAAVKLDLKNSKSKKNSKLKCEISKRDFFTGWNAEFVRYR